ncbi:MAG: NAD(+) synthase, partial [Parachlamydiaceae bacterium]
LCVDSQGRLTDVALAFEEDSLIVDLSAEKKEIKYSIDTNEELFCALILGLKDYFHKLKFTKACLGLSGGIDSALVACIAVAALGKENVLGVLMPSRYSSPGSITDAEQLAKTLGFNTCQIPIEGPLESYLDLLSPALGNIRNEITEENLQARIRGMILMAFSNKSGHIVLSTGNKSELAMGYSTLYGDMCGGLAVISDVTKQQLYALAHWINRKDEVIPWNTIHKPPSAELRLNQKDTDSLPDYSIVDNVLLAYIEEYLSPEAIAVKFDYPRPIVDDLISRIHRNEYKRRQSPPGLRISEKSFSIGRQFPIVQRYID